MMNLIACVFILLSYGTSTPLDEANLHYLKASYFLQNNNPELALKELDQAIAVDSNSAQLFVTQAKAYMALSQVDKAIEAFRQAAELDPSDPEPHKLTGRLILQRAAGGNRNDETFKAAETELLRAAEIDPSDSETLFFLGLLYDYWSKPDEAIKTKKKLLDLNPNLVQVWQSLAANYDVKGDQENELAVLKNALIYSPDNIDLLKQAGDTAKELGRIKESNTFYGHSSSILESRSQTGDISIHLALARLSLWDTRRFDLALHEFDRIIQLTQAEEGLKQIRIEAEIGKATSYFFMSDYAPALELYENNEQYVLTRYTNHIPFMLLTYSHNNEEQRALNILRRLYDSANYNPAVERLKSRIHFEAGNVQEAISVLESVITTEPEELENFVQLFYIYFDSKDFKNAAEVITRAEKFADADDPQLLFIRGLLAERLGDTENSVAVLTKLIEKEPDNHLALNFVGYTLAEEGKELARAKQLVDRALALAPNQGSYLDSLGWIYFKLGNYEESEKYLTIAVRTRYKSAEVREHLGYLYLKLKRPAEALREFQAALDNDLADIKSTSEVERYIKELHKELKDKQ